MSSWLKHVWDLNNSLILGNIFIFESSRNDSELVIKNTNSFNQFNCSLVGSLLYSLSFIFIQSICLFNSIHKSVPNDCSVQFVLIILSQLSWLNKLPCIINPTSLEESYKASLILLLNPFLHL